MSGSKPGNGSRTQIQDLDGDSMEFIFSFLAFWDLCACEKTCVTWRDLINDRRLYWKLTKRIANMPVPFKGLLGDNGRDDEDEERHKRRYPPQTRKVLQRTKPLKHFGTARRRTK